MNYRHHQLRLILKQQQTKWEQEYSNLENSASIQTLKSKDQKIKDLETALFNLAQEKVKGKKDAEKLLNDLETRYNNSLSEKEKEYYKNREQDLKTLAYYKSTALEIEKIIDSRLVIFIGKDKVLNYLQELKGQEKDKYSEVD